MTRIDDLIREHCPKGVEHRSLHEIGGYSDIRVAASDLDQTSFVGVDNLLPNRGGKVDSAYRPNTARVTAYQVGDVLIGNIRPYLQKVWLATNDGGCSGDVLVFRVEDKFAAAIDPRFLYYLLSSDDFFAYNMQHAKGAKMPRGDKTAILRFRIPIPPIQVQREVVSIMDRLTELERELVAALVAEVESREAQHSYYRSLLLSLGMPPGGESVPLSELVEFINGKPHERLVVPDGAVALLTARFISSAGQFARYVDPQGALTPAVRGDIAMVMSDLPNGRALARCFYVEADGAYTANQRVCLLRVRDGAVSPRYLYYLLDRNPQLLAHDNGQDQTHLKKGQILDVQIPVTSAAHQERVASLIDRINSATRGLISDIQAECGNRHKQYEYYRDRLLTFSEAA